MSKKTNQSQKNAKKCKGWGWIGALEFLVQQIFFEKKNGMKFYGNKWNGNIWTKKWNGILWKQMGMKYYGMPFSQLKALYPLPSSFRSIRSPYPPIFSLCMAPHTTSIPTIHNIRSPYQLNLGTILLNLQ